MRTAICYLSGELSNLSLFYTGIGLGKLPRLQQALQYASSGNAEPNLAVEELLDAREEAYRQILVGMGEVLEEPGNLTVPPEAMSSVWLANLLISKGDDGGGRSYLYHGLQQWYAVAECVWLPLASLMFLVAVRRSNSFCLL